MRHKFTVILISVVLSASCSVNYDPEIFAGSECIIVNAFLQPDSMITVHLYANRLTGNRSEVVRLQGAHVVLKGNGQTLYDGVSDSVLRLDAYPEAGGDYSIQVTHAAYPPAEAETSIPQPVTCRVDVDGAIYTVCDFQFPEKETPLWITCSALFRDAVPVQYAELFTNNILIDNINRSEGYGFMDIRTGSGYHEGFLRIKPENQPRLNDIVFQPWLMRSILWDGYLGDEIRLIAASREYDRYNKTFYQRLATIVDGDELVALLYQPVQVYTNIKGGLGIFAGKSETCYYIKYEGENGETDERSPVLPIK
jgi:hypothetical protein